MFTFSSLKDITPSSSIRVERGASERHVSGTSTFNSWKVSFMNSIKCKGTEFVKNAIKQHTPPTYQEKKAFLMSETFQNEGPIHLAIQRQHHILVPDNLAILELLLKHKANPNAYEIRSDGSKISPLKYAIQNENVPAVKLLLNHGALPSKPAFCMPNGLGKTPLTYAKGLEPTCKNAAEMRLIIKLLTDAQNKRDQYKQLLSANSFASGLQVPAQAQHPVAPDPNIKPRNLPPPRPVAPVAGNMTKAEDKIKELETALNLQEQLESAEEELKEALEEVKRKEKELFLARRKTAKVNQDITKIKSTNGYKDRESIASLTLEISQLSSEDKAIDDSTAAANRDAEINKEITTSCPVCYEIPKEIYECQNCHNMTCGECVGNLPHCPMCRQDFKEKPPVRNVLAERIINNCN